MEHEKEFINNVSDNTLKTFVNMGILKKSATIGAIRHNIPQHAIPTMILKKKAVE